MSVPLTTDDWVLIAVIVTVIYLFAMRWCMPTPKAKLRVTLAPPAGWIFLLPSAVVKGYSVSHTLFIYSSILLTFVIMMVPVRKRLAADILVQEQNPLTKVAPDTFSMCWIGVSASGCILSMVYLWPVLE